MIINQRAQGRAADSLFYIVKLHNKCILFVYTPYIDV